MPLESGGFAVPLEISLTSTSQKVITAFGYAYRTRFGDGKERFDRAWVDLAMALPIAADEKDVSKRSQLVFTAGGTRKNKHFITVLPGRGLPLDVEVYPLWATFEDRSAIGDTDGISEVLRIRSLKAVELDELIDEMELIRNSSNLRLTGAKRLAELAKDGRPSARDKQRLDDLHEQLDGLLAHDNTDRQTLTKLIGLSIEALAKQRDLLEQHSTLKESN